jgi:hypothetical protein
MDDLDNISKAIALLEKYESYLFRKAWGLTLIVFGVVIPLTALFNMMAPAIASVIGISTESFMLLTSVIIWIIGSVIIFYSFATASKISSKKHKFSFRKEMPHIIAIALVWAISFTLINFAPENIELVSNMWAAGAACVFSYLILRKVPSHANYPEIFLVGLILLVASIPIFFISELLLAQTITIVVFAVSFVIGGFYSILMASHHLDGNLNPD